MCSFPRLSKALEAIDDAQVLILPPPPIQGIGNAGGFTMQIELRDGSIDFAKLQSVTSAIVGNAQSQSALQHVSTTFRATAPQIRIDVDRVKAQTVHVSVDQVFSTLATYFGSTYVQQFNKFGRVFQVYVQADAAFRLRPRDIDNLWVRNQEGDMIPLGTLVTMTPTVGPPLISLYNLYPSSSVLGLPAQGFSSGEALRLMEQNAASTLPPGATIEWTGMSYQEKIVGHQMYFVFAMALLLVYLVLAGQYESWYAPLSIILSVPLALVGPVLALSALRIDNNLYTQIGIILLIALSAKNAILIVDVARDYRLNENKSIVEAAVDAARARFRPIIMTSFAFILGVAPLVVASGAGASARSVDRHCGVQRDDRLDLSRGPVRAVDVCGSAALRGVAARAHSTRVFSRRNETVKRNSQVPSPGWSEQRFRRTQSQFGRSAGYLMAARQNR